MQNRRALNIAVFVVVFLLAGSECFAGMTVYTLRDIYRLRFDQLSFFVFLLLTCALLFQLTWNYAAKGLPSIPKLNFKRALSLSFLLGLAMLLILTMISGIREVLTPGAWRRQGTSYRLNDPAQEPVRRRNIEYLRTALFDYARVHDGKFPPHDFVRDIPEKLWESPDQLGTHYIYHGGLTTNDAHGLLAIEPPDFGEKRMAIITSGEIQLINQDEIDRMSQPSKSYERASQK